GGGRGSHVQKAGPDRDKTHAWCVEFARSYSLVPSKPASMAEKTPWHSLCSEFSCDKDSRGDLLLGITSTCSSDGPSRWTCSASLPLTGWVNSPGWDPPVSSFLAWCWACSPTPSTFATSTAGCCC